MKIEETKNFYLCGIDWQHQIGETSVRLYKSLKELKKNCKCTGACGVVEISMRAQWILKQDLEVIPSGKKKLNAKRKIQA